MLALADRGGKSVNSASGRERANGSDIVRKNIHGDSRLPTDESKLYLIVGRELLSHETVNHAKEEYVRGDVTTNSD